MAQCARDCGCERVEETVQPSTTSGKAGLSSVMALRAWQSLAQRQAVVSTRLATTT